MSSVRVLNGSATVLRIIRPMVTAWAWWVYMSRANPTSGEVCAGVDERAQAATPAATDPIKTIRTSATTLICRRRSRRWRPAVSLAWSSSTSAVSDRVTVTLHPVSHSSLVARIHRPMPVSPPSQTQR